MAAEFLILSQTVLRNACWKLGQWRRHHKRNGEDILK